MRFQRNFFILCLIASWTVRAEAQTANLDAAVKLILSFYKEDEVNLDAGEFSGKFAPEKRCQLLRKYFFKYILQNNESKVCILPPLLTRYPSYELNFEGSYEPPPKYKIVNSSLKDDRAEVAIEMKHSEDKRKFIVARTEWILRFSNDRWLIHGARICDSYISPKDIEVLREKHSSTFAMYRCTDFGEPSLSPNLTPN